MVYLQEGRHHLVVADYQWTPIVLGVESQFEGKKLEKILESKEKPLPSERKEDRR